MPYRRNSLYCISIFHCWFFHSEYLFSKTLSGKIKMPLVQIVSQIPSTLGKVGRNLFPKAAAVVEGISRHVVIYIFPTGAGKMRFIQGYLGTYIVPKKITSFYGIWHPVPVVTFPSRLRQLDRWLRDLGPLVRQI